MSQKSSEKALPVFHNKSTGATPRDRLFGTYTTLVSYYLSKEHGVLGTAAIRMIMYT